jgi:hypothetical protein
MGSLGLIMRQLHPVHARLRGSYPDAAQITCRIGGVISEKPRELGPVNVIHLQALTAILGTHIVQDTLKGPRKFDTHPL